MTPRAALTLLLLVLVVPCLSFAEEIYPPSSLQQDFVFIVQTIQDVHPNPYAKVPVEKLEQKQVEIEAELTQPLTAADFYELVEPYVASLGDDHTSLVLGEPEITPGCESEYRRRSYLKAGVGVLELETFGVGDPTNPAEIEQGLEEVTTFFEQAFTEFQETDVTTLVVDLRKNSGGHSRVGDELVGYLTDQPYRMFARIEAKLSKQFLDQRQREGAEIPEELASAVGELEMVEVPLEAPVPTPLRFGGDVFVLVGPCTASSATDFAAVVKDFHFGTVVGEETGGLPTHVGNSMIFTLPETGLELRVSSMYFVRPGGFDDGRGVLPDCKVKAWQAMQAVLSGRCEPLNEP